VVKGGGQISPGARRAHRRLLQALAVRVLADCDQDLAHRTLNAFLIDADGEAALVVGLRVEGGKAASEMGQVGGFRGLRGAREPGQPRVRKSVAALSTHGSLVPDSRLLALQGSGNAARHLWAVESSVSAAPSTKALRRPAERAGRW